MHIATPQTPNIRPWLIIYVIVFLVIFKGSAVSGAPAETGDVTIRFQSGDNIRAIAESYLDDPDLWIDVLRANGLTSPHELQPGMTLLIPVEKIRRVNHLLKEADLRIRTANEAGARIFAWKVINRAVEDRDTALEYRRAGEWENAALHATQAVEKAEEALVVSMENREVPAEAVIYHFRGHVHSRKPTDNIWNAVSLYETLEEGEKSRTLSQSSADIQFRDDTRIHLKENASALIRKLRTNLLNQTQESEVRLIQGDVMALLGGRKTDPSFQLDVPGVETDIQSRHYWVGSNDKETRFANYDGEIRIRSGGGNVILKKNQGSVVPRDKKPSAPKDLLPAPRRTAPQDGARFYDRPDALSWTPVPGADQYWIEFSDDDSFTRILKKIETSAVSTALPEIIGPGAVFWRVTALSAERLPGRPGTVGRFEIVLDETPPYLALFSPKDESDRYERSLLVSGDTERGSRISVNGTPVPISGDGRFTTEIALEPGQNQIVVTAADPAGNVTKLTRTIRYRPEGDIPLVFDTPPDADDPNRFLVRDFSFVLSGKTAENAKIRITDADKRELAAGAADDNGRFRIAVSLDQNNSELTLTVAGPAGGVRKETVRILVDDVPPRVSFDETIPEAVRTDSIVITGTTEEGVRLTLNDTAVPLKKGRFRIETNLSPGDNRLRFAAVDPIGNVTVVEKAVRLDTRPPALVSVDVTRKTVSGGTEIRIVVHASDESGLARIAPIVLTVGNRRESGRLIRTGESGPYEGAVFIPEASSGGVKLQSVLLSDYLGNRKRYRF